MALSLGYLVMRPNGRYSVRFQKPNGRWTHQSLGTSKAAQAKISFDLWKQQELKKKFAGIHDVEPVPLKRLAEEHLADVRRHQAKSWHQKQQYYLFRTERDQPDSPKKILEWFGASKLTTDVTVNDIRNYVDYRRDRASRRSPATRSLHASRRCCGLASNAGTWLRAQVPPGALGS